MARNEFGVEIDESGALSSLQLYPEGMLSLSYDSILGIESTTVARSIFTYAMTGVSRGKIQQ